MILANADGTVISEQVQSVTCANPAVEAERQRLEAIALAALRKWLTADSFARLFVFGPSELEDAGKALIEFESRHGYKPETKTA